MGKKEDILIGINVFLVLNEVSFVYIFIVFWKFL